MRLIKLALYKQYIFFVLLFYLTSIFTGYYAENRVITQTGGLLSPLLTTFFANATLITILYNNLLVTFINIVSGFFSFGLIPIFFVCVEGWKTGYVIHSITTIKGIFALKLFFIGVFPHGILEIPAFLLSSALGLYNGLLILKKWHNKQKINSEDIVNSLTIYNNIVAPLLFIAALIETIITPIMLSLFI